MQAQQPAFYHLSTAEGLSDNNVYTAARDRNGMVWIGTGEGLNSFDGNRITAYYKQQYPQLPENSIAKVLVDDDNKVWIRTAGHYLTALDEKRHFHKILIGDSTDRSSISSIFYSKKNGLIVLKGTTHYFQRGHSMQFEKKNLPFEKKLAGTPGFVYFFENDKAVYYRNSRLVVINYATLQAELDYSFPGLTAANHINDDELLLFTGKGDVFYRFSISQQKIIKEYRQLTDQYNLPVTGTLRTVARIDSSRFAFTTYFAGLYLLDIQTQSLAHWVHDPVNPRSIGGNNTMNIKYDTSGYLFVTTQTSGLHFYNLKEQQAFSKPYFMNEEREVFDGYIQSIVTDKNENVWMGAQDRLIKWNRKNDQTTYIPIKLADGSNVSGNETIRVVEADSDGNLWVGTSRYGIYVFDDQQNIISRITPPGDKEKNGLPSPFINAICQDGDTLWVGTPRGVCKINKTNFTSTTLTGHPLLQPLAGINCTAIWKDDNGDIWAGSYRGVWHYNKTENKLINYSTKQGLSHNTIEGISKDNLGNYYFTTLGGLSILSPNGKITNYDRSNGLRNDRCEGLLKDAKGFMWIGNLNCIIRYDPLKKNFAVFEEGYGFSHAGFRMRSAHITPKGEMIWGTDKGLVYFYPGQMTGSPLALHPFIHSLQAENQRYHFTNANKLIFSYNTSSFVFNFSSGELSGDRKNQLQYQLAGFDEDWKQPASTGQAVYGKLPPGNYTFKMRASRDGNTWYNAAYNIELYITKPWWQQLWFRLLGTVLLAAIIFLVYRYFRNKKRTSEINKTVAYFANSSYEQSTADTIYRDITRNCIARFGFEDCVIYVPDYNRKVLIQKAAYGPKNNPQDEIVNPIEIPFGKGIVGFVAETENPLLVPDTRKDSRYIVDDEMRLSELTVPVIHEGKVIAIIDAEHSRKNFFTRQHLAALQSIASLCAAKISRSLAVEAMKKNREELMELNVKMAESKFMNLRLQMNPHFLFNSLSAIQHLIVSQQTNKAYKYLTVFSNFLRSLLNFAEKNFIPLDEELKILRMYTELESLRFDESFSWEITMDENLGHDEVLVPSLMVQPFAENAIWHGLLHKAGEKKLTIRFSGSPDDVIICTVTDNGIGRVKAAQIKESNINAKMRESRGIQIIKERLELLQQKTGKPATVEIEDLYNDRKEPCGTRVKIIIPYYNPEEV